MRYKILALFSTALFWSGMQATAAPSETIGSALKNVDVSCKKFFPAVGMTLTVPCGAEIEPDAPTPPASTVSPVDNTTTAVADKAKADAKCVQKLGKGVDAGEQRIDGSYPCIPSKVWANAKCVEINRSGFYAGAINSKGGFKCYPGKAARTAECRRKFGRRSRAGQLHRDGKTWTCYRLKRRITRRARRRRR
jgi:hypothetical protein